MIHRTSESGRTRIVVTVVLVLVIGAVGAIVVPRLLHEAEPPVPSTLRAEICIGVPANGLASPGRIRVTAKRPGVPPLDLNEVLPQATDAEAVLGRLAAGVADPAWSGDAHVRVAGSCLSFASVTAVGGDPGGSGASMSWAVSGRPGQGLVLRLSVTGGPDAPIDGARVRVALSARGVVTADGVAEVTGAVAYEGAWEDAAAIRSALVSRMREAAWTVATDEEGGLVVLGLPEDTSVGSAILTVEYPSAPENGPPYTWSIGLRP